MSGHSKWSSIKRQKGLNDKKKGATFTKLSNAISIAVREGGNVTDPEQNFRLRLAIEAARIENMPKENIQRAIERVLNKQLGQVEEVVYEGFGPEGICVIVEAVTDNKNRTTAEVKNIFDKNGGTMGKTGSVAYQFKQIAEIAVAKDQRSFDEVFLEAADSGAEDIEEDGDELYIYTDPSLLAKVRDSLLQKGFKILQATIVRKAINTVELKLEKAQKLIDFLNKFEDLDDVQKTYSNFIIQDDQ